MSGLGRPGRWTACAAGCIEASRLGEVEAAGEIGRVRSDVVFFVALDREFIERGSTGDQEATDR